MNNQMDSTLIKALEIRWLDLLEIYDVDQKIVAKLFQELLEAFSEPHRHYHNLNHLHHMFQALDSYEVGSYDVTSYEVDSCIVGGHQAVTREMLWAVWYHDVIYKPGASTNEKKSAIKAKESMMQLNIQQSTIDKVLSLILATENHKTKTDDINTQLFLDADMAILGSDKTSYLEYCNSVRQEHSSIPDFLFNRGRKKFLLSVLEQNSIFMSSYFKKQYEKTARENIKMELCILNNSQSLTSIIKA